uniref:Uncharacterized protein n=1 Tax=Triparma pacifica TaxID=91992 RepID=A0A7S2QVV8_9STRA
MKKCFPVISLLMMLICPSQALRATKQVYYGYNNHYNNHYGIKQRFITSPIRPSTSLSTKATPDSEPTNDKDDDSSKSNNSLFQLITDTISNSINNSIDNSSLRRNITNRPPLNLDFALPLIIYDVFLLMNLSISLNLWVYHSISLLPPFTGLNSAFVEGSRLSVCWEISSISSSFYHPPNVKSEPAIRAATAYTTATALLLTEELARAAMDNGIAGNLFLAQEIGFGGLLMVVWRTMHSELQG